MWDSIKTHRCCFDPKWHRHLIDQASRDRSPKKYVTKLLMVFKKMRKIIAPWAMYYDGPCLESKVGRALNLKKGLPGWVAITGYCYCQESGTDLHRHQTQNSPTSFSFHRLTSFFLFPLAEANEKPPEREVGKRSPCGSTLKGAEQRSTRWDDGQREDYFSYFYCLLCSSSWDPLSSFEPEWDQKEVWLRKSRKRSLPLDRAYKSSVFSILFKVTYWHG